MYSNVFYFPGWTRKAISFTIDDGNVPLDRKFINIVKPAGIKGTFNLCPPLKRATPDEYRALYEGYEIANHCKHHPLLMRNDVEYKYSDEPFSQETADKELLYKTEVEGIYKQFLTRYWSSLATPEAYCRMVDEGKTEIEEIFGEGSVEAYVWPYRDQENEQVHSYIKDRGYTSIRRTGCTTFDLPNDRFCWSYGANHSNLNERAMEFEAIPDDGRLRWFCFGVHAHDFENNNCWDVLERFATDFGNRPQDFWYATVRDVFHYEDAVNAARVSDSEIVNPTSIPLYAEINGKKITVNPYSSYVIE